MILVSSAFVAALVSGFWTFGVWCARLRRRAAYLCSEQVRIALLWPINRLFIGVLSVFPHTRHGRIRLIAMMNDDVKTKGRFVEHSSLALALIERYAPRQYARLSREVRFVVDFPPHRANAAYVRALKLCQIDHAALQRRFPTDEQRDELVCWFAWLLVHEGTHGHLHRLHVPHTAATNERIEWICNKRAWSFLNKLPANRYAFLPDLIDQISPFASEWWKPRGTHDG